MLRIPFLFFLIFLICSCAGRPSTDDPKLSEAERRIHSVTVSLDLCKNKRPPCHVTQPPIDYFMDPHCGLVREYLQSDIPEDDRWVQ